MLTVHVGEVCIGVGHGSCIRCGVFMCFSTYFYFIAVTISEIITSTK